MLEPVRSLRNAMGNVLKCALLSLSLVIAADAWGQIPSLAKCTRSANLLACVDPDGNAYSVNTVGSTIYLRGFEVTGKRYWAQTSSRYGQLTFSPASPPMAKPGSATVAGLAGPPSIGFPAPAAAVASSRVAGLLVARPAPFSAPAARRCSCSSADSSGNSAANLRTNRPPRPAGAALSPAADCRGRWK